MTFPSRRLRAAGAAALFVCVLAGLAAAACRRAGEARPGPSSGPKAGDALFLAAAPAWIPEENDADLGAMGIRKLYVAAATLGRDGKVTPLPPPPVKMPLPVVLTVMAEPGASAIFSPGGGATLGSAWAKALAPIVSGARGWAETVGIHLHVDPTPEQAPTLADAVRALRAELPDLPVSVTLRGTERASSWKPLAGAVEEALLFAFGRRPELGDQLVPEISDETARDMPLPFRLLLAPGGFGRGGDGTSWNGPPIPDGEVDALAQDRTLDFGFGQVLSDEAGTLYTFRLRPGARLSESKLAPFGSAARFQLLTFTEAVRLLALASRWTAPNLLGRAFLLEGVPRDGHLVGFSAVRDLLSGKPLDLKLQVEPRSGGAGARWSEFSIRVTNLSSTPSDLSHYNNWVQVRVEGGVFSSVKIGGFDRFELLSSGAEGYRPVTFEKAVVARFFENLFAPGEVKQTEGIRVTGARPTIYLSWHLTGPDGKIADGPETEADLGAPEPPARPARR